MVLTRGQDGINTAHLYNFSTGLLASLLGDKSERPVVDKTGLTGHYNLEFREPAQMSAPSTDPNGSRDEPMPAMADVLKGVGLKLESAKEPVEKLVVDRMEKPTEN